MFGLRLVRIRGRSMEPALYDGDLAIGRGLLRLRVGQVVLVDLPGVGFSVKRLVPGAQQGRFGLQGDSPLSAPTVDMPQVSPAQVHAVLVWVWRQGRIRRVR